MKLTTMQGQLLNAALLAERIVGKKESLPVLSCILIDAEKNITLRATNLEAGIEVSVPGEIAAAGVLAVPAGVFAQTLRSVRGDKISLESDGDNLLIESRGSKTLIKTIPHAEFPALPPSTQKPTLSLPREKFLRAIGSVVYAASSSMIRPELGSIYVSAGESRVTCVATDSFRLAEKTISGIKNKSDAELLIPLKHAIELSHIIERAPDDNIDITIEESQMTVSLSGIRYISRVIDAQFPNYKEIIPRQFETQATVLKSDFADMLKKARVFAGAEQHVGLHVYPKKKIFSATARSSDVGEMSDSLDAALEGEDLDINFHIGYLAEALSSIESDSITLGFAGASRPLVVKGVSDASFLYLVMPLNR